MIHSRLLEREYTFFVMPGIAEIFCLYLRDCVVIRFLQRFGLTVLKNGIILQSGVEGNRFTVASFTSRNK